MQYVFKKIQNSSYIPIKCDCDEKIEIHAQKSFVSFDFHLKNACFLIFFQKERGKKSYRKNKQGQGIYAAKQSIDRNDPKKKEGEKGQESRYDIGCVGRKRAEKQRFDDPAAVQGAYGEQIEETQRERGLHKELTFICYGEEGMRKKSAQKIDKWPTRA